MSRYSEKPPNKACSGLAGFCAIYKHFSGFGLFLLSGIFPARPHVLRITPTVSPLNRKGKLLFQ
jgi:hypothetical protein